MRAIDRCICPPLGMFEGPYLVNSSCSVHGRADAILASGEYTDRRGDYWHLCGCTYPPCNLWHQHHPSVGIGSDQMRLLIERDQHRNECPGLALCRTHPVPFVILWPMPTAIPAHTTIGRTCMNHERAVNEAQLMAVTA